LAAALTSHARTVSSCTPSTNEIPDRSTRTRSIFKAIITFSSEVRRSKKTVSWVSEKVVSQCRHRKIRRFLLSVMYVEMALTLPLFIRLKSGHSALGHGCPQSLGRLMRQSSDQVGMLKT